MITALLTVGDNTEVAEFIPLLNREQGFATEMWAVNTTKESKAFPKGTLLVFPRIGEPYVSLPGHLDTFTAFVRLVGATDNHGN